MIDIATRVVSEGEESRGRDIDFRPRGVKGKSFLATQTGSEGEDWITDIATQVVQCRGREDHLTYYSNVGSEGEEIYIIDTGSEREDIFYINIIF